MDENFCGRFLRITFSRSASAGCEISHHHQRQISEISLDMHPNNSASGDRQIGNARMDFARKLCVRALHLCVGEIRRKSVCAPVPAIVGLGRRRSVRRRSVLFSTVSNRDTAVRRNQDDVSGSNPGGTRRAPILLRAANRFNGRTAEQKGERRDLDCLRTLWWNRILWENREFVRLDRSTLCDLVVCELFRERFCGTVGVPERFDR
jgi:hypothetical protein